VTWGFEKAKDYRTKIISPLTSHHRADSASEVTPGLLAGAEPDTHQFSCHDLINGRSNG
jgi:hypothetical protein